MMFVCSATARSRVDPCHVSKGFLSRVALADWNSRRIARRWFFFFLFDSWVIEILHLEHRLCENFEKCFRMVDTSDTRRLLRTCMLRVILCLLGLWRPSWWRLHCSLCYFIFYWRLRGVIILTSCWKGVVQEPTIQPLPRLVKAGAKMGSNEEVCALKVWCLRFCCSWASEKEVKFMLWLHRTH